MNGLIFHLLLSIPLRSTGRVCCYCDLNNTIKMVKSLPTLPMFDFIQSDRAAGGLVAQPALIKRENWFIVRWINAIQILPFRFFGVLWWSCSIVSIFIITFFNRRHTSRVRTFYCVLASMHRFLFEVLLSHRLNCSPQLVFEYLLKFSRMEGNTLVSLILLF